MPKLSPKNASSPIFLNQGPIQPDFNFSNIPFKPLGSADTWVGRNIGKTYYDWGFNPYKSQVDQRYYNQGVVNWVGNAAAQLGIKTILGGISGLAATATSFTAAPFNKAFGYGLMDTINMNPLTHLTEAINEKAESLAPLFNRQDYDQLSFFKQLTPERLDETLNTNIDTISFVLQSMIGAEAAGTANFGTRIVSRLSGTPLTEILSGAASKGLAKWAGRINYLTADAFLAGNEAIQEASEGKSTAIEALQEARRAGKNTLTDPEIEKRANDIGRNIFWENFATLMITNIPFLEVAKPMFLPKGITKEMGFRLLGSKWAAKEYKTVFEKFLFDKGFAPGVVTKELLGTMVSEGIEESMQYSIQKVNNIENQNTDLASSLWRYGKSIANLDFLDLKDPERMKAFGMGAIFASTSNVAATALGAVPSFKIGSVEFPSLEIGGIKQAKAYRERRKAELDALNTQTTNYFNATVYKKTPDISGKLYTAKDANGVTEYFNEADGKTTKLDAAQFEQMATQNGLDKNTGGAYSIKGKYELDADGKPIVDDAKVAAVAIDSLLNQQLMDLMDNERVKKNPNELKMVLYRNKMLDQLAYTAKRNGAEKILMDKFKYLKDNADTEFEAMGYKDADEMRETMDYNIAYFERASNIYDAIEDDVLTLNDAETTNRRKMHLYHLANNANTLRDLQERARGKQDSLISGILQKYKPSSHQAVANILTEMAAIKMDKDSVDDMLNKHNAFLRQNNRKAALEILDEANTKLRGIKEKQDKIKTAEPVLYEKISQDSETEPILQASNEVEYLDKAITENARVYDALMSPSKGRAAFREYLKGKRNDLRLNVERSGLEIPFDDTLTPEIYSHWEDRQVMRRQFKQQTDRTHNQLYSSLVSDLADFLELNTEDPEKAAAGLRDFVEKILETQPKLEPEAAAALKQMIIDFVKPIKDRFDEVSKTLAEWQFVDGDVMLPDYMLPEGVTEAESQALIDEYYKLKDLKRLLRSLDTDLGTVLRKIDDLVNVDLSDRTDDQVRKDIALELVSTPLKIFEAAKLQPDGSIDPDYTDLASITTEISKLKALIPIFKAKGYTDEAKMAAKALGQLNRMKKLVEDNISNKERVNVRQNVLYANGILDAFGVDQTSPDLSTLVDLAAPERTALEEVIKTNPVTGSRILLDVLNGMEENKVPGMLEKARNNYLEVVDRVFAKNNVVVGPNIKVGVNSSPDRVFRLTLYRLSSFSDKPDAKNYLSNYSITQLAESTDPDMQELTKAYLALRGATLAQDSKNSSYYDALTKLVAHVDAQSKSSSPLPTPSSAQERVVLELLAFLQKPFDVRREAFTNVAALKAPAGAGKSVVVLPTLLKLAGIKPENILTLAGHAPAAAVICKATGSIYKENTVESVIQLLDSGTIPKQVNTIVFDEAATVGYQVMYSLIGALNRYMANNNDHKIKLLLVYDPNQITTNQLATPRLESDVYGVHQDFDKLSPEEQAKALRGELHPGHQLPYIQNITDISPLSVTYRSDVPSIVDAQNKFLSNDPVDTVSGAATSDVTSSVADILGVYTELGTTRLLPNLTASVAANPGRSRVVIVGSKSKKAAYEADLKAAGLNVEVLTSMESSGITRDEAYIDIEASDFAPDTIQRVINQHIYTALSRASKFAHLSRVNGTNSVDTAIRDKAAANAELKKTDYEKYLAERRAELDVYKTILGVKATKPAPKPAATTSKPATTEPNEPTTTPDETAEDVTEEPSDIHPVTEYDPEIAKADEVEEGEDFAPTPFTHILQYPQTSTLQDPEFDREKPVILIKEFSNGKSRIVVGSLMNYKTVRIVGILSDKEVAELAKKGIDLSTLPDVPMDKGTTGPDYLAAFDRITPEMYIEANLAKGSRPMWFFYDNNPTAYFDNPKEDVSALLKTYFEGLYGRDHAAKINSAEILANPEEFVKFRIYKTEAERNKDFPNVPLSKGPRWGEDARPYMVITGVKNLGSETTMNAHYISLEPAVASRNNEAWERFGGVGDHAYGGNDILSTITRIKNFTDQIQKET